MFSDVVSDVNLSFWGCREYEGIPFFIEPETKLDDICPFKKPKKLPCPHQGLCLDNFRKWNQKTFLVESEVNIEDLLPKTLQVRKDLTFVNANWTPSLPLLRKMLTLTNAVPLVIYGLRITHDYNMFFNLARTSVIRPVIILGADNIPVPQDFRENQNDNI